MQSHLLPLLHNNDSILSLSCAIPSRLLHLLTPLIRISKHISSVKQLRSIQYSQVPCSFLAQSRVPRPFPFNSSCPSSAIYPLSPLASSPPPFPPLLFSSCSLFPLFPLFPLSSLFLFSCLCYPPRQRYRHLLFCLYLCLLCVHRCFRLSYLL